ncbi:hypothetical protein QBC46DRAFT_438741 [Diplogelasinospora grovesii]|uniref:AAA+ ATPase domain-containing protein n=1 Tax=Diplogelasinospora grovesii TaxID=303347 RepID=A0AAN6N4B6_9PEZI|nr:hypothetical protein QBC46DRAFT_438741 [Diplogelasinospora grovesii]
MNKDLPVVFVRPFKVLVDCERRLQDWRVALEHGEVVEGEGNNGLDKLTKSRTALEHVDCLLNFIDTDIKEKQAYLNSPNCRPVYYSDLWHLFRPGQDVIRPDGKQAYRIIKVTSSPHFVLSAKETPGYQVRYRPKGNTNPRQMYTSLTPPGDPRQSNRCDTSPGDQRYNARFSITCVYIDFDGKTLGPVETVFTFSEFEGLRNVVSLTVYPIRFHPAEQADFSKAEWKVVELLPKEERCRRMLMQRGVKFVEVIGLKPMYYSGPTLLMDEEIESQVVVDVETAFPVEDGWKTGSLDIEDDRQDDSRTRCRAACCRKDYVVDDTQVDKRQAVKYIESVRSKEYARASIILSPRPLKELETSPGSTPAVTEDELVIMAYRVFGFVLRSRKWSVLDLSYMSDIYSPEMTDEITDSGDEKKRKTAFDRLVLEEWHRPMIQSLIAQHFRDKKSTLGRTGQFDIVKGKGKGLILLLHGAPGVGKTSTAEGAAEFFKKPLFQITSDLGVTATEVEKSLEKNFTLASRWDCILLLDEADVFLAERTRQDFVRNGLVAAFLRVLEYYTGVLFLTTNRIGDFDEAFTSRIHIILYYPPLNQDKTVEVFNINLDMIEERFRRMGRQIEIDKLGIGTFAGNHFTGHPHAHWNGRQIRNACQTALALAEAKAQDDSKGVAPNPDAIVKLGVKQFKQVQKAYLWFNTYMKSLYGTDEERRKMEAKVRINLLDEKDGAGSDNMNNVHVNGTQSQPQPHPSPQPLAWPLHRPYYPHMNSAPGRQGYVDHSQMQQMQQQMQMRQQYSPGSHAPGQQSWSSNQPTMTFNQGFPREGQSPTF